jgi:uncharacterized membrane protein
MDQQEKLKISSDFIFIKLVLLGLILLLPLLLYYDYKTLKPDTRLSYAVGLIISICLLTYLFTRPTVYYNDKALFIQRKKMEIEIPLENIQSIFLSVLAFSRSGYSYVVRYINETNEISKVRIFSSMFSEPISKFIKRAKAINPKIEVRNWSIGVNELFD